jgi:hypothetical protein
MAQRAGDGGVEVILMGWGLLSEAGPHGGAA